jgi:hypothetical protein
MSNVVTVNGPLSVSALAAAHAAADAVLPRWLLGDDATAMRTLCDELGFEVAVLERYGPREDLARMATDRVRRISQRYRRDLGYGAIDVGSIDDSALRSPDAHQSPARDVALAA